MGHYALLQELSLYIVLRKDILIMATKKKAATPGASAATSPEEKKKALETAISQLEKNFGKGTIMKMGENPRMNVSAVLHISEKY